MTRYRCTVIDQDGASVSRTVDARNRDQAVLLLIAEGSTPVSVARDSPSLIARMVARTGDDDAGQLLEPLARLVASGMTIDEAAALIDGDAARRIATGRAVSAILSEDDRIPPWISAALLRGEAAGDEARMLVAVAADAAAIAARRERLRAALRECGVIGTVLLVLSVARAIGDPVLAIMLAVPWYVAVMLARPRAIAVLADLRASDCLHIVARLKSAGAATVDAVGPAIADTLTAGERRRVEAAMRAVTPEATAIRSLADALGLDPVNRGLVARDQTATIAAIATRLGDAALARMDAGTATVRWFAIVAIGLMVAEQVAR